MSEKLPGNGIECVIVPRKTDGEKAISASTVRQAIKDNDMNTLKKLVPESTLRYFESEEGRLFSRHLIQDFLGIPRDDKKPDL